MDTRRRGSRPGDGGLPLAGLSRQAERTFRPDDVPAVRQFARAFAMQVGLRPARIADFVLAASEAMSCVTAWGPCITQVRLWMTGRRAFCEVRGNAMTMRRATQGSVRHGAAFWHGAAARGAARPASSRDGAAWPGTEPPDGLHGEEAALRRRVLRQVCDYVSVASGPDGAWVLLSMSVDSG